MTLNLAGVKVLIVEDQRSIRGLLTSTLRALGIGQVIGLHSAEEAIAHIQTASEEQKVLGRGEVSAVLLDIILEDPQNSGLDLVEWIRRDSQSPSPFMPIMMFSAVATMNMVQRSRDLGVNVFMRKPFSVHSLGSLLIGLLRDQRSFIKSDGYFGPDRRRRRDDPEYKDSERRRKVHDDNVKVYKRTKTQAGGDYQLQKENVLRAQEVFAEMVDAAIEGLIGHIESLHLLHEQFVRFLDETKKTDQQELSPQIQSFADALLDDILMIRVNLGVFRLPILSTVTYNLSEFVCEITINARQGFNQDSTYLIERFIKFMVLLVQSHGRGGIDEIEGEEVTSELENARRRFRRKYGMTIISQEIIEKKIQESLGRLRSTKLFSDLGGDEN